MALEVKSLEFNMFGEHTYIVWNPKDNIAAVIDPGMSTQAEINEFTDFIVSHELKLRYMINTHLHLDHSMGVNFIKRNYDIELMASPLDAPLAERIEQQGVLFNIPMKLENVEITYPLIEGDIIKIGDDYLKVIDVPGHTPGGIALYSPGNHFVFTGDSLFQGSIGRTDLPGGNHAALVNAVTRRLLTLPADTKVYPGHGPCTTIGHELTYNPYL